MNSEKSPDGAVLAKVTLRLIPFLFLLYIVAFLDRVNVGFAKLKMLSDLGFSDAVYGMGAGIFFIGYFLFEVPSNLFLEKVGARKWIARIMITWGLLAAAMMFIKTPTQFYVMRFIFGAAEAGFFPGMILYLTYWFPAAERAKAVSKFMTAIPVAGILGNPISGMIMKMNGIGGLHGWQWVFLLEGLPSCILGFVVLWYLPDGPHNARWLNDGERNWITARLALDREANAAGGGAGHHVSFAGALSDWRVWLLSLIYFCTATGNYGFTLWLPDIMKDRGHLNADVDGLKIGLLSAIPSVCAAAGMLINGYHSDKTGERRWHVALPAWLGSLGIAMAAFSIMGEVEPGSFVHSLYAPLACLSLAAFGMWATQGIFWTMPTAFLGGTAAAGGIALINSIGNLGGFVGPNVMGYLKESTHGFTGGLYFLSAIYLLAGLLALAVKVDRPKKDVV